MRSMVLVVAVALGGAIAQDRFGGEFNGRFRGFAKSPTEHMMNEFDGVPELHSVRGRVVAEGDDSGVPGALFELRTENPGDRVRGVRTTKNGRFRMTSIPDGIYVFKVTLNGFQSVYGRLKVTKKAPRKNRLNITLKFGV